MASAEKRERVSRVVNMMITKTWVRGESAKELAREWKCTIKAVEGYAAEASRHLAIAGEPEALRARVVAEMDRILEAGESDNARVQAGRLALEAVGALKNRHEIEVCEPEKMHREEVFSNAMQYPGFREWLVSEGWTPPTPVLEFQVGDVLSFPTNEPRRIGGTVTIVKVEEPKK